MQMIEFLVLAIVAGVVLVKLYGVLGRRTGAQREPRPQPAQGDLPQESVSARAQSGPIVGGPASGGIADLMRADPNFDTGHFLAGARGAYEMIVTAFAAGDKAALQPLLAQRVYDAYSKAIDERAARGEKGSELVRLKSAEVADAALENDIARVVVRFEAELAEGAHGLRDTKEKWTFERDVRSSDPNWKLARVVAA
ncbi:MAG: Tim44/TimA family putative adaptor protein [Hyphomonadaceae bacterium]